MTRWPMPRSHQLVMRLLGFEPYGHHDRFVVWWKQRGPIVMLEYIALHPVLRGTGYVRLALEDMRVFLRSRGVQLVVVIAGRHTPLWRRLGMVEDHGYLRMRID